MSDCSVWRRVALRFRWRDSQDNNQIKEMSLDAVEFIRRFLLHVLHGGFVKIRHFGFLSNRNRHAMVQRCRELLPASAPLPVVTERQEPVFPSLRGGAPPCDRTAINCTITPKRSAAPNTSDVLFVKMIVAIPILRPRRSPIRDDRRRVPPEAVWRHEELVAAPRPAEFPQAAHPTPPQLAVPHGIHAGEPSCTPETNPHRPA